METEDVAADAMLHPRRLIVSTVASVLVLFGAAVALGLWLRGPLVLWSEAFVAWLGGPGIAAGYFVPDAFTIPIPNDTFGLFGLAAGMPFWVVVAWGTGGSILGGVTGWFIGRSLRQTRLVSAFMNGRGRSLETLMRRNASLVVAVAAITPLPYSLSAWAAGGVGMPLGLFVLVSLTRVIRVAGSLYLIQLGLLTAG